MRVLVFFDLPTLSIAERREYTRFRRHLIKSGFLMMQESVYCKLALNSTASDAIMGNVRKHKPPAGMVQMLTITEKQFSKMEFVVGRGIYGVVDSTERLVIL